MHANFQPSLNLTLKFEGGWVDNIHDPGGATNMGITLNSLASYRNKPVSSADLRLLTRGEAAEIYHQMFWHPLCADDLPAGVDVVLFDYAVNSGHPAAVRTVQALLDCPVDGILGPNTLAALAHGSSTELIRGISDQRLNFLKRLSTFRWFGAGWTTRVRSVETEAMRIATSAYAVSSHQNSN